MELDTQTKAVLALGNIWEVKNSLVGFCFDTTASNTGVHAGSATIIQKELNCSMLWLSYRHHMYEIHIKDAGRCGERLGWMIYYLRGFNQLGEI